MIRPHIVCPFPIFFHVELVRVPVLNVGEVSEENMAPSLWSQDSSFSRSTGVTSVPREDTTLSFSFPMEGSENNQSPSQLILGQASHSAEDLRVCLGSGGLDILAGEAKPGSPTSSFYPCC